MYMHINLQIYRFSEKKKYLTFLKNRINSTPTRKSQILRQLDPTCKNLVIQQDTRLYLEEINRSTEK